MAAISRHQWALSAGRRVSGKSQEGFTGDHVTTTNYDMVESHCGSAVKLPNGVMFAQDIPSLSIVGKVRAGPSEFPSARNSAWSGLVEKARSGPASLGVAVTEWKQSAGMIQQTALGMLQTARDLRKGRLDRIAKRLGLPNGTRAKKRYAKAQKRSYKKKHTVRPDGRNRDVRRSLQKGSSAWLQYSFGWKPMMQDIYDAATILGRDVPDGAYNNSSGESYHIWQNGNFAPLQRINGQVNVRQYCTAHVDNHNSYMAQNAGIVNPLAIGWELIPFSFLADWCFDVGTALEGLTDLVGLAVSNGGISINARVSGTVTWIWGPGGPEVPYTVAGTVVYARRNGLSQPVPNMQVTTNLGTSFNRAANAVALLTQFVAR